MDHSEAKHAIKIDSLAAVNWMSGHFQEKTIHDITLTLLWFRVGYCICIETKCTPPPISSYPQTHTDITSRQRPIYVLMGKVIIGSGNGLVPNIAKS